MRDLERGLVLLLFLLALMAMLAFSDAGITSAASSRLAALQTQTVEVVVSVNPANIAPGQKATVSITLRNVSPSPIAPEVLISLPSSISARLGELPAGTIFNAQSGTLSWQPVMGGDGAELQLSLPIVAKVADAHNPQQTINVVVMAGGQEVAQETDFWVGLAPAASIRLNPPQVAAGQPIQLVGEVNGPGPVSQLWSLGDGRIVEAENPSVFYPFPGSYEVVFQASTPVGVVSERTTVNVVAQTIARFSTSDTTPGAGAPVQFVNESGGQQPLTYLWDFGDGSIATDANPQHTYTVAGTYNVRLFVTGATGQSETAQSLTVGSLPVADFIINETADAGSLIQGQAFVDDSTTSIVWDMGDGRTFEGQVIEHVYWSAGDYPVTVTVANEFGETRMLRSVRVNPGPYFLYLPLLELDTDIGVASATGPQAVPEQQQLEATQPTQQPVQEELPTLDLPDELSPQERLLAYVNEARRLNGLAALSPVSELAAAAQQHADDMALNGLTGHTGSDGSVPALRVQMSGYPGGYAGEATAWGMAEAIEPVRYWLASPGHRTIILNPAAKEIGVGFAQDYQSPSVWYWTAEFASLDLPVIRVPLPPSITPTPEPVITLLGPPTDGDFALAADTNLIFTWSWPVPLSADERFGVYLNTRGRTIQLGTVSEPQSGDQYEFKTSAGNVPALAGQQTWFIQLEDTLSGITRERSDSRSIVFTAGP